MEEKADEENEDRQDNNRNGMPEEIQGQDDDQDENEENDDDDRHINPPNRFREVLEEDILNEVAKRKILNMIIQGEAKNTKHMLHSEVVRNGLNDIYGQGRADEIFAIWDEITKISDKIDWVFPLPGRQATMEENKDMMAGACFVDWENKDKDEEDDEEYDGSGGDYSGEEDDFDIDNIDNPYGESEKAELDKKPIIRARGLDFPMLLHETVKGIYDLLSLNAVVDDPRTAEIVANNTGLVDEPEDWRYGPEIAGDIRDFVNENTNVDMYPNIKEILFRTLSDKDNMETVEFLTLIKGILMKTAAARRIIDNMIREIIARIEQYNREMHEYEEQMREWEEHQRGGAAPAAAPQAQDEVEAQPVDNRQEDPNSMSPREIQAKVDQALEEGDFVTAGYWSRYIK
jgi:hypothetical protein